VNLVHVYVNLYPFSGFQSCFRNRSSLLLNHHSANAVTPPSNRFTSSVDSDDAHSAKPPVKLSSDDSTTHSLCQGLNL
jgi:hypothetical protein